MVRYSLLASTVTNMKIVVGAGLYSTVQLIRKVGRDADSKYLTLALLLAVPATRTRYAGSLRIVLLWRAEVPFSCLLVVRSGDLTGSTSQSRRPYMLKPESRTLAFDARVMVGQMV